MNKTILHSLVKLKMQFIAVEVIFALKKKLRCKSLNDTANSLRIYSYKIDFFFAKLNLITI